MFVSFYDLLYLRHASDSKISLGSFATPVPSQRESCNVRIHPCHRSLLFHVQLLPIPTAFLVPSPAFQISIHPFRQNKRPSQNTSGSFLAILIPLRHSPLRPFANPDSYVSGQPAVLLEAAGAIPLHRVLGWGAVGTTPATVVLPPNQRRNQEFGESNHHFGHTTRWPFGRRLKKVLPFSPFD